MCSISVLGACLTGTEVVSQATGLPGRHLDSWLMPPDVCRQVFARGSRGADLAVIEGTLEQPTATLSRDHHDRPGGLGPIARALDLPTIALISCPRWEGLHLPGLPEGIDAVLIDGLEDPEDFDRISSAIRLITRKPVIGAVEALPEVRAALYASPKNTPVADSLIARLAESFRRFVDLPALKALAQSRPFPADAIEPGLANHSKFRVAYAPG